MVPASSARHAASNANGRLIDVNGPVICGIEDSNGARAAAVAYELAERYGLPLVYVHVLVGSADVSHAARMLLETAPQGVSQLSIETGHHPADRLVELAVERGASFLVVGNHGPRASLLGSISADISRRAPCPVIVVPSTARPAAFERFALETARRQVA